MRNNRQQSVHIFVNTKLGNLIRKVINDAHTTYAQMTKHRQTYMSSKMYFKVGARFNSIFISRKLLRNQHLNGDDRCAILAPHRSRRPDENRSARCDAKTASVFAIFDL